MTIRNGADYHSMTEDVVMPGAAGTGSAFASSVARVTPPSPSVPF